MIAWTTTWGSAWFSRFMMILKLSFAPTELVPILSQISIIIPHFSEMFFSLVAFSTKIKTIVMRMKRFSVLSVADATKIENFTKAGHKESIAHTISHRWRSKAIKNNLKRPSAVKKRDGNNQGDDVVSLYWFQVKVIGRLCKFMTQSGTPMASFSEDFT